jgi:hypothetical protein
LYGRKKDIFLSVRRESGEYSSLVRAETHPWLLAVLSRDSQLERQEEDEELNSRTISLQAFSKTVKCSGHHFSRLKGSGSNKTFFCSLRQLGRKP